LQPPQLLSVNVPQDDRYNAIKALNSKLRRAVKIRGHFPNDDAAMKLIYLVLRDATAEWKMSAREWSEAKSQFAILFEERFIIR
jgi:putative transposase